MSGLDRPERRIVGLDDVLITEELARRPSRPSDHSAEAVALGALADMLAADPQALLQTLVDLALGLCRAHSAGVSLLEPCDGAGVFRWHAVAGRLAHFHGGTIERDASPCGTVVDRDAVLLFAYPERHFRYPIAAGVPLVEALLVPFHANGKAVGTVWAVAHNPERKFDAEDARLLTRLSRFAAAGYRLSSALAEAEAGRSELERRVEARTRQALAAARMGIWTWDVSSDAHVRDANLNRLLGLGFVESNLPLDEFLGHIHPDDREAVSAGFEASIRQGRPLTLEFRIVRPDGTVRWLRDQGDVFGGPAGPASHMAGACVDVTDLKEAEAALRASEERSRLILASATDYAIFTLDPDRRVTGWSPGAEAIFGYAEAEIVGRSGDIIFTPEDRAADAPQEEALTALREGRAADERWHLRKDGSRFFASGVLSPLGEGGSLGFVKVARDLTDRKRMEDTLRQARDELERRVAGRTAELARANEALTELLRRLVTAQEDERRRISRELHDGLGQELTALILGLKAVERAVPEGSPGRARLQEVEATAGRIGREVHDLAIDLRPTALDDIGLAAAMSAYVTGWSDRTGVAAAFQPLGLAGDRLPPEVETTVYRVVQEALNNVAKHAEARHVSIIVERRGDELTALIEDDGRGFDEGRAASGPDRRRLGLLGMRERVGLVGGTLLIESGDGEGTTVRARIPLWQPAGEAGHDA